jgi:uncharacterized protein (TIGR02679 family)
VVPLGLNGLAEWVADPLLRPAWERVRARFEKSGLIPAGVVVVPLPTRADRHAMGALLGRPVTRGSVRLDLVSLDTRLKERSGIGGLNEVLTEIFGQPPRNRPADRADRQEMRERPLALAATLVSAPWGAEWVADMRRVGLLTRVAEISTAEALVRDAARVFADLSMVPADSTDRKGLAGSRTTQSRIELSARLFGNAHALDRDRLLHRVVVRGLAAAAAVPVPESARDSEELWARFGVEADLLSRTCLVWRLEILGESPLANRLSAAAESGDPLHITARDLRRVDRVEVPPDTPVLVCENPAVLEAFADRGGSDVAVVCTSGEPNLVVDEVLIRLAASGASLRYHGDFDWAGVAIANRAVVRYGVRPWLMGAGDYLRGVRLDGPELRGASVPASWDPDLCPRMQGQGRAVHEESVLEQLLAAHSGPRE